MNIFFAIGIILSFRLWTADRFFPLFPIFEGLSELSPWLNHIVTVLLVISLLINQLFKGKKIFLLIFALLILLFLQDQMRWQAWVYVYVLMLLPFSISLKSEEQQSSLIKYLQIAIVGIYIWSGIHKINPAFIDVTFRSILIDFFGIRNTTLIGQLRYFGYIIPGLEILAGILLVSKRLRKLGVMLVTATHIFILIYLSPLGVNHNVIVYPWNISMTLFSWLLFYGQGNKIDLRLGKNVRLNVNTMVMSALVLFLPVLNFFGYWDHYLSFSLYSDKTDDFYIAVADEEMHKIDPRLKPYFVTIKDMKGGVVIDVNQWALDELKVPFYPERRLFEKICRDFCQLSIENDKMVFLVFERPIEKGRYDSFTCPDLKEN